MDSEELDNKKLVAIYLLENIIENCSDITNKEVVKNILSSIIRLM